jgi:hypothetical protein
MLWQEFQTWINLFGSLRWIFTDPSSELNYLNISIQFDKK